MSYYVYGWYNIGYWSDLFLSLYIYIYTLQIDKSTSLPSNNYNSDFFEMGLSKIWVPLIPMG